jgi:hypothetical protein
LVKEDGRLEFLKMKKKGDVKNSKDIQEML